MILEMKPGIFVVSKNKIKNKNYVNYNDDWQ